MAKNASVNYRTFVIANPAAGAGSVGEEWRLIERLLRANLPELDYAFTEGPGHATLLAREALRAGWEMIVSVGGDGTLNEVLNGFYERPEPQEEFELVDDGFIANIGAAPKPINADAAIGLVPMGTGGDFRKTLGFMDGIADNVEHLRGRDTREIDLGQIAYLDHQKKLGTQYFINIAAGGMSGLVDHYVNKTWKGFGGTTSFVLGTVRAFAKWRNAEMEIRLDGTTEFCEQIQNVIVANGAYFGAGMWIAPGAEPDDGAFEVILMGDLTSAESVAILPKIYKGTHLSSRKVNRHRASEVAARTTESKRPALLDVDGEQPGQLPALWTLHPKMIRFKV